jgi:hypothetical protein
LYAAVGQPEIGKDFVVWSTAALPGEGVDSFVEWEALSSTQGLCFEISVVENVQSCVFVDSRRKAKLPELI